MQIKLENLPVNRKIPCIKAIRYATDMGLYDAKVTFERLADATKGNTISVEGELSPRLKNIEELRLLIHGSGPIGNTSRYGCELPQVTVKEVLETNKIKTNGQQVFNVPNTEQGRAFIKQLSHYLNRPQYAFRSRGRGPRPDRSLSSQLSIALDKAEWIAVYVQGGNVDGIRHDLYKAQTESLKKDEELARLRLHVEELKRNKQNISKETEELLHEINTLRRANTQLVSQIRHPEDDEDNAVEATTVTLDGDSVTILKIGDKEIRIEGNAKINIS